ncbi:MAG TPA: hypothetical protein VGE74_21050 [Gemmata sp.]
MNVLILTNATAAAARRATRAAEQATRRMGHVPVWPGDHVRPEAVVLVAGAGPFGFLVADAFMTRGVPVCFYEPGGGGWVDGMALARNCRALSEWLGDVFLGAHTTAPRPVTKKGARRDGTH